MVAEKLEQKERAYAEMANRRDYDSASARIALSLALGASVLLSFSFSFISFACS